MPWRTLVCSQHHLRAGVLSPEPRPRRRRCSYRELENMQGGGLHEVHAYNIHTKYFVGTPGRHLPP